MVIVSFARVILAASVAGAVGAGVATWGCSTATCDESATCAGPSDASASSEASSAADASGPFCPQPDALFCDDFDVDRGARAFGADPGASISVGADDGGPSPPNTLQIFLPAVNTGGSANATYSAFDAGSPMHLHLAFAMRLEFSSPGGGAAVFGLIRGKNSEYQMYLDVDPSGPSLSLHELGASSVDHPFRGSLADFDFGQWHTYDLVISYEDGGKTFKLTVDGRSDSDDLQAGWSSVPIELVPSAGVTNRAPTGTQHVDFDNIVLYAD